MRLKQAALGQRLQQGIAPIYLIFGAEPLLIEECLDQLRAAARQAGFTERRRYSAEAGFDWNQLFSSGQSLSLFADRRVIELRLPTGKPAEAGNQALVEYAAGATNPDTTLIIIGGSTDKRGQTGKWFKAIDRAGVVIECPTVTADKMPDWIAARLRSKNLTFEPDVAAGMSRLVEGNLLAAAQEINLLSLLSANRTITLELVTELIADHARFNLFNLVDAGLRGATAHSIRMLYSLRREQAEPILILWGLAREVRLLCQLSAALAQGENMQVLFQRLGIWRSRAALMQAALRRLKPAQCRQLLRKLAQADLMLKGRKPLDRGDIWEEIEHIVLGLCGLRLP